MCASNTEVRCAVFTRRGIWANGCWVCFASPLPDPAPPPSSSKSILEFSLGGLEGRDLALLIWEEGLSSRRELYRTVLGVALSARPLGQGVKEDASSPETLETS